MATKVVNLMLICILIEFVNANERTLYFTGHGTLKQNFEMESLIPNVKLQFLTARSNTTLLQLKINEDSPRPARRRTYADSGGNDYEMSLLNINLVNGKIRVKVSWRDKYSLSEYTPFGGYANIGAIDSPGPFRYDDLKPHYISVYRRNNEFYIEVDERTEHLPIRLTTSYYLTHRKDYSYEIDKFRGAMRLVIDDNDMFVNVSATDGISSYNTGEINGRFEEINFSTEKSYLHFDDTIEKLSSIKFTITSNSTSGEIFNIKSLPKIPYRHYTYTEVSLSSTQNGSMIKWNKHPECSIDNLPSLLTGLQINFEAYFEFSKSDHRRAAIRSNIIINGLTYSRPDCKVRNLDYYFNKNLRIGSNGKASFVGNISNLQINSHLKPELSLAAATLHIEGKPQRHTDEDVFEVGQQNLNYRPLFWNISDDKVYLQEQMLGSQNQQFEVLNHLQETKIELRNSKNKTIIKKFSMDDVQKGKIVMSRINNLNSNDPGCLVILDNNMKVFKLFAYPVSYFKPALKIDEQVTCAAQFGDFCKLKISYLHMRSFYKLIERSTDANILKNELNEDIVYFLQEDVFAGRVRLASNNNERTTIYLILERTDRAKISVRFETYPNELELRTSEIKLYHNMAVPLTSKEILIENSVNSNLQISNHITIVSNDPNLVVVTVSSIGSTFSGISNFTLKNLRAGEIFLLYLKNTTNEEDFQTGSFDISVYSYQNTVIKTFYGIEYSAENFKINIEKPFDFRSVDKNFIPMWPDYFKVTPGGQGIAENITFFIKDNPRLGNGIIKFYNRKNTKVRTNWRYKDALELRQQWTKEGYNYFTYKDSLMGDVVVGIDTIYANGPIILPIKFELNVEVRVYENAGSVIETVLPGTALLKTTNLAEKYEDFVVMSEVTLLPIQCSHSINCFMLSVKNEVVKFGNDEIDGVFMVYDGPELYVHGRKQNYFSTAELKENKLVISRDAEKTEELKFIFSCYYCHPKVNPDIFRFAGSWIFKSIYFPQD